MAHPLAANIITGFLGSGKTSLLKHVLSTGLKGERTAVIVNEVADLGIDGTVLRGLNVDQMVELSSGCVCCSGILRLGLAVQEIVETVRPSILLVETSGLSAAGPLVSELRGIGVRTDAVITVADAVNVPRFLRESDVAREQVTSGDFLVINKTDLLGDRALGRVERSLRRLNDRALFFRARFGVVDDDILFASSVRRLRSEGSGAQGSGPDPSNAGGAPAPQADHGYETFVVRHPGTLSRKDFEQFLTDLPVTITRAKGIVRFEGEERPTLFSSVCGRSSLDWLETEIGIPPVNQGVFIGKSIGAVCDEVTRSFQSCGASGAIR